MTQTFLEPFPPLSFPSFEFCWGNAVHNLDQSEIDSFIVRCDAAWQSDSISAGVFQQSSLDNANIITKATQTGSDEIIAVFLFELISPPQDSLFTQCIRLYWYILPETLRDYISEFSTCLGQAVIHEMFPKWCATHNYPITEISFLLLTFPQIHEFIPFITAFTSPAWEINLLEGDQIRENTWNAHHLYRNSYHLYYSNPSFHSHYLPERLAQKMTNVTQFFHSPSQSLTLDCFDILDPKNLSQIHQFLSYNQNLNTTLTKLTKRLKRYKHRQSLIWSRLLFAMKSSNFPEVFNACFKRNLEVFRRMGFRLRIYHAKSSRFNDILTQYQSALLRILYDSSISEGSVFSQIFTTEGKLRSQIFELEFLRTIFRDYIAIIEVNLGNNSQVDDWVTLGTIFGKDVKSSTHATIKTESGSIFGSYARGYGLGTFSILYAMILGDFSNINAMYAHLTTVKNQPMQKIFTKLGYRAYGKIPNMLYSITNYVDDKEQIAVDILRYYKPSIPLLKHLLLSEDEPSRYYQLQEALRLHLRLKRTITQAITQGTIEPIFF